MPPMRPGGFYDATLFEMIPDSDPGAELHIGE
jgi:hypothetical protein